MEPSRKVKKTENSEFMSMIGVVQEMFFNKLQSIEEKIDKITSKYFLLEKKVDNIISSIQSNPVNVFCTNDYPDGSWLGDPDNPEFCVRCPIAQKDLEYINNHCTSPEKMSLMLLDYLFPRETQACSNISGLGKYKKKQLDPYKIQAIKLHVKYKFGITESDWNRIKINIDSKCRTAFRRKVKGLPVNIRGKKGRPFYIINKEIDDSSECDLSPAPESLKSDVGIFNQSDDLRSDEENSLSGVLREGILGTSSFRFPISSDSEMIDAEEHTINVIHATREQFEMIKQNPSVLQSSDTSS